MSDAEPSSDRSSWAARGVGIDQIEAELDRLHRAHQRDGHALARTLNLIVAPGPSGSDRSIDATLAALGDHSPSRTLVLRPHAADRLDAEATLECRVHTASGRVGICHDQVVLSADEARLGHAASLLAPLLLTDLPTVLWLPGAGFPISDPRLLDRVQHVLVDSAIGPAGARRMAELARRASVHDLAWGRLEFWRAATAAAFEPLARRRLLAHVSQLELAYGERAAPASVLLAGWVAARAGWRPEPLDGGAGAASRPDGGKVDLLLRTDSSAGDCGGIQSLTFRAGSKEIRVGRGAATNRLRDLFGEALQPLPAYSRGYREAVEAAAVIASAEPD